MFFKFRLSLTFLILILSLIVATFDDNLKSNYCLEFGAICSLSFFGLTFLLDLLIRATPKTKLLNVGLGILVGLLICLICKGLGVVQTFEKLNFFPRTNYCDLLFELSLILMVFYASVLWCGKMNAYFSKSQSSNIAILDTSVLVDGRVFDVAETIYFDKKLLIPRFVLNELQLLADSHVGLTRGKGRRGFELIKKLQSGSLTVEIDEIDYSHIPEVDDKLLLLAREKNALLLTTDYNLEQLAKVQKIKCLNLNGLAAALKARCVPGDKIFVNLIKAGSEAKQGVGFLDDGTMVVVAEGQPLIGARVEISITSVVQGKTSRIFFGKINKKIDQA